MSTTHITARVATWSTLVNAKRDGWTGKVTKSAMKRTLNSEHHRKVEFYAVASTDGRTGYFFIDEIDEGTIEVRYNGDRDLLIIDVTQGKITVR